MPSSKKSSKKTVKNAFYFFMLDVRQMEEAKGNSFKGLKEVAEIASPLWDAMTFEEKELYNRKAKEAKGSKDDGHNKFTSLGVSFATIDAQARELEEATDIMLQTIRNTVRSLDRKSTLLTHKFYLCHVNYFYKTEDFYCAAEIALSEFNLKEGLLDTIHSFIDPGIIHVGCRFEANDWAEKTHGIPYEWDGGEKDYCKLFTRIKTFLKKDKQESIPPVYTMPDSLNSNTCLSAVKSAFNTLCEACAQDPGQFRVFPFSQLFYEIRNKCGKESEDGMNVAAHVPSLALVENEIEKDVFSYAKDLGCTYHENIDRSIHCSLSIVTRWVYTICDHCCKHVGITLELGKHCPADADVNWDCKYSRKAVKSSSGDLENTSNYSKEKNSFMPTIIDHGKLREIREQEYLKAREVSKKAEESRLPRLVNPERPANLGVGIRPVGTGRGFIGHKKQDIDEPAWPVSGRGKFLQKH